MYCAVQACSGSMLMGEDLIIIYYITKVGLNSLPIASLDLSKMLNMFCEGILQLYLQVIVGSCGCVCACVQ